MDLERENRSIIKAISLFGGVQIWKILIGIFQNKLVAYILGAKGIAIIEIFSSSTSIIESLTSCGLASSGVKSIAEAKVDKRDEVISLVSKLTKFTGILAMVVFLFLAPFFSKVTFGNYDFTFSFVIISFSLLFKQLSVGQSALLQGLKKYKELSVAGVLGAFSSFIISVPIYYFLGINGIALMFVTNSLFLVLFTWIASRKIKYLYLDYSFKETLKRSKNILFLGLAIACSGFVSFFTTYLTQLFIGNYYGLEVVGFYSAGLLIVNKYAGLVFSAMGTDYLPRLSAVAVDNMKSNDLVNRQITISLILLAPLIGGMILCSKYVISILYTKDFYLLVDFLKIASIGIIFKATSWGMSYLLIAKGKASLYVKNEIFSNVLIMVMNILGYNLFQINGIAYAYIASYIVYALALYVICKKEFNYVIDKLVLSHIIILSSLIILTMILSLNTSYFAFISFILVCIYSIIVLDRNINIKTFIFNGKNNK